jgi:Flp pilus assembly protein TadG
MQALRRALRRRARASDRGSAALFVAVFAPAMLFLAGLVIDGGSALEAKQRASDIAEQAARAAAGQCDVALLRSAGDCRITSHSAALAAASPYLQGNGVTSWNLVETRQVAPGEFHGVQVSVTIKFQTTLLGIVPSFKTLTINETAEAVAVTGL